MKSTKKYPVKLAGRVEHVGLVVAAYILEQFLQGTWVLDEDEYEELCDALIALLGDSRDERYRLRPGSSDIE